MKKLQQHLSSLLYGSLCSMILAIAMCAPAWAASSGIAIDSVDISIDYDTFYDDDDMKDDSDVSVQILTDGVYLEDKSITNLPSIRWSEGTRPVLKLVLYAKSGYYFSSYASKTDNIYVKGNGDCTSASRSDSNSCLTVKIKLEEVEESDDDDDDDDDWYWDDWSYYYSGSYYSGYGPSGSSQSSSSGAWLKDSNGWWYCYPNKTYPRNTWLSLNGNWYYFGDNGYLYMNKWVLWNNVWYYCGPNGVMLRNAWTPDGYWVDSNGAWSSSRTSSSSYNYNYNSSYNYNSYSSGPGALR